MTGSEPSVQRVARVIPKSVINLVRPNCSVLRNLGASTNKLKAPIAKPIEMPIVDRMLCFWIMPISCNKKLKVLDKEMKNGQKKWIVPYPLFFEEQTT